MYSRLSRAFLEGYTAAIADITFTETEVSNIAAQGPWPPVIPSDPGNELSGLGWAEQLGKLLFNDTTLSKSGLVSCGTCHQADAGFSDGLPVAVGEGKAVRNTQGLLNVGLQHWFGWDGGADSLWSASLRPLLAEHEMGQDVSSLAAVLRSNELFMKELRVYIKSNEILSDSTRNDAALTDAVLSEDTNLIVLAAKSIGAYTRTLRSGLTPFDGFRKALLESDAQGMAKYPDEAKRGLKLFIGDAKCHVCHFGPNFSNGEFHDIGLPFFTAVGQVDPGRYKGIERVRKDPFSLLGNFAVSVDSNARLTTSSVKQTQSNWGSWRTPSLRNLTLTAPYMHNGSLSGLKDVIDWYSTIDLDRLHTNGESLLKPLNFSEQQKMDLVAFLESLSLP